jgi:two-component system LytT family response regulator
MDHAGLLDSQLSDSYPPAPAAAPARAAFRYLARIAVRTRDRLVIVPTGDIVRIDAEGNYVRLWTDRSWLHKDTLTALCARLDPAEFLRVHRSHAVNMRSVRELLPRSHGEFRIRLVDGSELTSGRNYRDAIRTAFALD